MLSSKPDKSEAKFATRLEVLAERVDTLASTVATTASALAKKDGELAALRRELAARDDAVQALAARVTQAPAPSPDVDANELRSLRNAVAALTKAHAGRAAVDERAAALAEKVDGIAHRLDVLAAGPVPAAAPDPELQTRLAALEAELEALRSSGAERPAEADRRSEELQTMLVTLRTQLDALASLRASGSDDDTERRFAAVEDGLVRLGRRIDALATTLESSAAVIAEKERELSDLHRHFTEASTRFEGVADDIRGALSALPELGSADIEDLKTRLDHVGERLSRFESASRETAATLADGTRAVEQRLDLLDERLTAVASEVARAKTLWPVALRSLEARLEDVASHARPPEPPPVEQAAELEGRADEDLLAGLRDSLQAMESVAAELAKPPDTLTEDDVRTHEREPEPEAVVGVEEVEDVEPPEAVAAAGATVVPLRSSDP